MVTEYPSLSIDDSFSSPEEVERQFYEALQQGDLERLKAVWAETEEVACIHPGGAHILGLKAICDSFAAIFKHGTIDIDAETIKRYVTHDCAIHHVMERIRGLTSIGPRVMYVVATNVYALTNQGWRMVLHHASPNTEDPTGSESHEVPPMLH